MDRAINKKMCFPKVVCIWLMSGGKTFDCLRKLKLSVISFKFNLVLNIKLSDEENKTIEGYKRNA